MENDYLQALAQVVLPTEILDYFSITGIAQTTTEIHISLDERMNKALSNDAHFESKGFTLDLHLRITDKIERINL